MKKKITSPVSIVMLVHNEVEVIEKVILDFYNNNLQFTFILKDTIAQLNLVKINNEYFISRP